MISAILALIAASTFTGVALYINCAEHSSRLRLDDQECPDPVAHEFRSAAAMQSSLAIVSAVSGGGAYWMARLLPFLIGAVLMFANLPWTMACLMPTNRILWAMDPASAGAATRALLKRWNDLHTARTLFGAAAVASFAWGVTMFVDNLKESAF